MMISPPAISLRKTGWTLAGTIMLVAAIGTATGNANWGPGDFVAAALLFGLAGAGLEVAAVLPRRRWRGPGAALVLAALLLIWAELAVGIFH
jgi:hypothetical protein